MRRHTWPSSRALLLLLTSLTCDLGYMNMTAGNPAQHGLVPRCAEFLVSVFLEKYGKQAVGCGRNHNEQADEHAYDEQHRQHIRQNPEKPIEHWSRPRDQIERILTQRDLGD
jgi:hypothetical protein